MQERTCPHLALSCLWSLALSNSATRREPPQRFASQRGKPPQRLLEAMAAQREALSRVQRRSGLYPALRGNPQDRLASLFALVRI